MRVPRVRFTVRRLMIVVAIVTAIVWGVMLWLRAVDYRSIARQHALMEKASVIAVIDGPDTADSNELAWLNRVWATHHAALRRKYEYAAARPWVSVAPDPPDPIPLSRPGRRVDLHFGE